MDYYAFALQVTVLALLWITLQLWHYLPQLTKRIKRELKAFYEDETAVEQTMSAAHGVLVKKLHADMEKLIAESLTAWGNDMKAQQRAAQSEIQTAQTEAVEKMVAGDDSMKEKAAEAIIAKIAGKNDWVAALLALRQLPQQQDNIYPRGQFYQRQEGKW